MNQMENSRAARVWLDSRFGPGSRPEHEQLELDAFMSIFHPGHDRIILEEDTHDHP